MPNNLILTINNSYSSIQGLTATHEKELRKLLSYTIGGSNAYFSGYGIRKASLLSKKCEFPTGLLQRVTEFLVKFHVSTVNNRKIPIYNKALQLSSKISPYYDQTAAVKSAIAAGQGIIAMPTGTGKSLVIAMLAAHYNIRTLIVCPSLEIKKQLTTSLLDTLGNTPNIVIENIQAASLKQHKNFDMLIIDEAHHSAAKTYRMLNRTAWTGIYHRFFLTATPYRNDAEEELLFESIAGNTIYNLNYITAISKGYIVPVQAYYYDLPKKDTEAFTWAEVYKELVVNNNYRNGLISNIIKNLDYSDKKSLCLVKEVQHGVNIAENTNSPFVTDKDPDSRKYIAEFNEGNIRSLIGTTGILGEGIDTKPAEFVIIAGLGKAKSAFMQQIGRAVRTYPGKTSANIILFRDRSHKYLLRHFNSQCKVLKDEFGIVPIKLEGL